VSGVRRRPLDAYLPPLFLVALGALVITFGESMPAYTDPGWQRRFADVDFTAVKDFDSLTTEWYAAKLEVETPRNRLVDLGMGFIALGVGFALLFALTHVRSFRDIGSLRSPSTRYSFLALSAVVWLSFIPAEWNWLGYALSRGDYPHWADSIGIPMYAVQTFGQNGLPVVLVGVLITLRGTTLPVKLWSRPILGRAYVVNIALIIAGILALLVLLSGVVSQPFLVPSALFTLYLLLSGRAAAAVRGRRALR
jgi:hypothetical protein